MQEYDNNPQDSHSERHGEKPSVVEWGSKMPIFPFRSLWTTHQQYVPTNIAAHIHGLLRQGMDEEN